MAYEASEIMAATALKSTRDLKKIKTVSDLEELIIAGQKGEGIEFGPGSAKTAFLNKLKTPISKSAVANMAVGVSAAKAIRKYMKKERTTDKLNVYLSGNTWPPDIADFQIEAYGFKDYNSADLVVTTNKRKFYGISLKKKKSVTASDPTLINKAVSSVFSGADYGVADPELNKKAIDDLTKEITKTRIKYFAGLVRKATKESIKILLKKDLKNFNNDEKLFAPDKKAKGHKEKFGDRTYIDTKGYWDAPKGGYLSSDRNITKHKRSMRKFVNTELAKRIDNPLWEKYKKAIKNVGEVNNGPTILAEHLINIILKVKLYDKLKAKKLEGVDFDFALITGIGDVKYPKSDPDGIVKIGAGRTYPLKTTLCGLKRIAKKYSGPYKVEQDTLTEGGSTAAKIFFKIMKGAFHIMDLRIRYKGTFNPKPQYQANMSKEFKEEIKKECTGG